METFFEEFFSFGTVKRLIFFYKFYDMKGNTARKKIEENFSRA